MTEVIVHPYDWVVKDKGGDQNQTTIHCWALDRDSVPYLLRIEDFPVSCFVELPSRIRQVPFYWNQSKADQLIAYLARRLENRAPTRALFRNRRKVCQAHRVTPFLLLCFRSLSDMGDSVALLRNKLHLEGFPGPLECQVWENNIPLVRKLLTARDIRYSQWFRAVGEAVDPDLRISSLKQEYLVRWDDLIPIPAEESQGWISNPAILSFDIECYSDNHRAMPDEYNARHVITMISCIYQRYQRPETRKRYAILIGDCEEIPSTVLSDCRLIRVKTELELIDAFSKLIIETDPEILAGYNILKFDIKYLNYRLTRRLRDWPVLGRLLETRATVSQKSWESKAYGKQESYSLVMDGRINLDMYPIIQRDYKLERYSLGFVSSHFLGRTKHDISAAQMFRAYEHLTQALKSPQNKELYHQALHETSQIVQYCIRDAELVTDLIDRLNIWVSLIELSNIVGVTVTETFTRGQQVRCLSQLYNLACNLSYVVDKREVSGGKYKGGSVHEPIPGLYDNVICLDFSSLYPSIIMAYNICYTTYIPPELLHCYSEEDYHSFHCEGREGGEKKTHCFLKQPPGLLPELVRHLVSERRAVRRRLAGVEKELKQLEKINLLRHRLIQKEPVSPEALEQIEDEVWRTDLYQLQETGVSSSHLLTISQELKQAKLQTIVLDKRQLALKISANSFYGFLGVQQNGVMPLMEGAVSITARGRELIEEVRCYIEQKYGGIQIYSDTDSTMVKLPHIKTGKECNYWGLRLTQEINGLKPGEKDCDGQSYPEGRPGLFPSPLAMDFEKSTRLLCITKKKYAAYLINKSGEFILEAVLDERGNIIDHQKVLLKKGIVLARRDNFPFLCQTYEKILLLIMERHPLAEVLQVLLRAIQDLKEGRVPYQQLVIVKGLSYSYKNDSSFMKVFSERLKRIGKIVNAGDRLDFLIVVTPSKSLGSRARLVQEYLETDGTPDQLTIDYNYYIKTLLGEHINRLLFAGYASQFNLLPKLYYRPTPRHNPIHLDRIAELIYQLHKRSIRIEVLMEAIELGELTDQMLQKWSC